MFNSKKFNISFGIALTALSIFLFSSMTAFAYKPGQYGTIFGWNSRKIIWFVGQIHQFFGAFVLGVPMFAVILEYMGYRNKNRKLDSLAAEFTTLLSIAYATTAAAGALLAFSLFGLYPSFMNYLTGVFKEAMWIYAFLFIAETFILYIYCYGWDWLKDGEDFHSLVKITSLTLGVLTMLSGILIFTGIGPGALAPANTRAFFGIMIIITGFGVTLIKNRKGTHIFLGILLNVIGTIIMLSANSWASFMMSPVGVAKDGTFVGTILQAVNNPLWMPLAIHRVWSNLTFGGFVAGAYAAVRFIGAKTQTEREHYDWMGYVSNFIGLVGLLPLPFAGYKLGREVYSVNAVMGNNMMGGDFSWSFIIQGILLGAIFITSNYYLWAGMGRIPGAERYQGYIKYLLLFIVISIAIWLTPHNLPLSGAEIIRMGGRRYHPILKYLGLMPAKNAAVNLILLTTFFSFLLYKRANKKSSVAISKQSRKAKIAIITAGVFCLWLVGGHMLDIFNLDPKSINLSPENSVYFRPVAWILFIECLAIVVTTLLTLKDRGILGQYIYLVVTAFNSVLFLGVYGFVVMEKANPFLRDIALVQFIQVISCYILVATIDVFLFRNAKDLGPIRWGRISIRAQYALIILCILSSLTMGLMGYVNSGLRTNWHIYGVLQDTSKWAFTPDNYTMTKMVGGTTMLFLLGVTLIFWISSLSGKLGDKGDRRIEDRREIIDLQGVMAEDRRHMTDETVVRKGERRSTIGDRRQAISDRRQATDERRKRWKEDR